MVTEKLIIRHSVRRKPREWPSGRLIVDAPEEGYSLDSEPSAKGEQRAINCSFRPPLPALVVVSARAAGLLPWEAHTWTDPPSTSLLPSVGLTPDNATRVALAGLTGRPRRCRSPSSSPIREVPMSSQFHRLVLAVAALASAGEGDTNQEGGFRPELRRRPGLTPMDDAGLRPAVTRSRTSRALARSVLHCRRARRSSLSGQRCPSADVAHRVPDSPGTARFRLR